MAHSVLVEDRDHRRMRASFSVLCVKDVSATWAFVGACAYAVDRRAIQSDFSSNACAARPLQFVINVNVVMRVAGNAAQREQPHPSPEVRIGSRTLFC